MPLTKSSAASATRRSFRSPKPSSFCFRSGVFRGIRISTQWWQRRCSRWRGVVRTITSRAVSSGIQRLAIGAYRILRRWRRITRDCCAFSPSWCSTRPPTSFAKRWFRRRTTCAAFYAIRKPGFFAGSQDADEAYYELPLEERRKREAPYVDRTSYTNWTCALAGAQCLAARALDDDALLDEALQTLDNVAERLVGGDGLLFHVLAPGDAPTVSGLFADQVAYARALLDAHEISGETRFLSRAQSLVDAVIANFESPEGGFYDRLRGDEAFGRLAVADRPIVDNGLFAEVLLRLSGLTGDARYRERAESVLRAVLAEHARCRSLRGDVRSRVAPVSLPGALGSHRRRSGATDAFREAALRLPTPFAAIRTLSPGAAAELEMPAEQPAAYVCVTGACGAPVRDAGGLARCLRCARCVSSLLPLLDVYAHNEKPYSERDLADAIEQQHRRVQDVSNCRRHEERKAIGQKGQTCKRDENAQGSREEARPEDEIAEYRFIESEEHEADPGSLARAA